MRVFERSFLVDGAFAMVLLVRPVKLQCRNWLRSGSLGLGLALASGCGDDTVSSSSSRGTESGSGDTVADSDSAETGDTNDTDTDDTDTDTDTDTDDTDTDDTDTDDTDTDTDTDGDAGQSAGAWVNAGENAAMSSGYRLRFTFGQSSTNQDTMTSRSYRLRGGLVPAID